MKKGNYAVIITLDGCQVTSACTGLNSLGIGENAVLPFIKVYPNPTADYVHIDMGDGLSGKMELMDLNGKIADCTAIAGKCHCGCFHTSGRDLLP